MYSERITILFDGPCNLCNRLVKFSTRWDAQAKLSFVSLQSDAGRALLREVGLPPDGIDSLVLIEGQRYFLESTAVLRLLRHLDGPWPFFAFLQIIPRPIRDAGYRFVARNRYRWFGKNKP